MPPKEFHESTSLPQLRRRLEIEQLLIETCQSDGIAALDIGLLHDSLDARRSVAGIHSRAVYTLYQRQPLCRSILYVEKDRKSVV